MSPCSAELSWPPPAPTSSPAPPGCTQRHTGSGTFRVTGLKRGAGNYPLSVFRGNVGESSQPRLLTRTVTPVKTAPGDARQASCRGPWK